MSSKIKQREEEFLARQEQMLLVAHFERQKVAKEASRSKSGCTVITVEDDGLSMSETSQIPAHIRREQEEILNDIQSPCHSTAGAGAADPPPPMPPARTLSRATLQETSAVSLGSSTSRRKNRVRQRPSFTYSLPSTYDEQIAHSASTEQQANIDRDSHNGDAASRYSNPEDGFSITSHDQGSHHSSSRSSLAFTLSPTPGVPSVATMPSQSQQEQQQARADQEAKRQMQIPGVAEALAKARAGRQNGNPETPLNPSSPNEVDVDSFNEITVEKVPASSATVSRNSNGQNPDGLTSFQNSLAGAFRIGNAGDKPVHPSDITPPQQHTQQIRRTSSSSYNRVPHVIQHKHSESDHTLPTVSTITRTAYSGNNGPLLSVPVADLVSDSEDSCEPPIPATIVRHTEVRMTAPPESDDPERDDQRQQQQPPPTEQKSTLAYFLGGGGCFVVAFAIVLLLCRYVEAFSFMGFYKGKSSEDGTSSLEESSPAPVVAVPTQSPTPGPTAAPTPFVLDLPNYTMDAIIYDPIDPNNVEKTGSPQARAYHWLVQDIAYDPNRPIARQYQRFALATLYYATNRDYGRGNSGEVDNSQSGDAWKRSGYWLEHGVDECDWETAATTGRDLPTPYQVCNEETGLYESLVLYDNGLKGFVPPELSFITTLQILDLGRNDLQYAQYCIPSQVGLLTNLHYLNFFFSYGKGPVPSELGRLTNLKTLNLERNRFIGTLPSELGLMRNLEHFDFERNQLQGTLPPELGVLLAQNLWELNVENNYMTGSIPEAFNDAIEVRKTRHGQNLGSNGKFLKILFRGNTFTGTIPEEMCSLQQRLDFDCTPTGYPQDGLCGCTCECAVPAVERGNPDNNDFV